MLGGMFMGAVYSRFPGRFYAPFSTRTGRMRDFFTTPYAKLVSIDAIPGSFWIVWRTSCS